MGSCLEGEWGGGGVGQMMQRRGGGEQEEKGWMGRGGGWTLRAGRRWSPRRQRRSDRGCGPAGGRGSSPCGRWRSSSSCRSPPEWPGERQAGWGKHACADKWEHVVGRLLEKEQGKLGRGCVGRRQECLPGQDVGFMGWPMVPGGWTREPGGWPGRDSPPITGGGVRRACACPREARDTMDMCLLTPPLLLASALVAEPEAVFSLTLPLAWGEASLAGDLVGVLFGAGDLARFAGDFGAGDFARPPFAEDFGGVALGGILHRRSLCSTRLRRREQDPETSFSFEPPSRS